MPYTMEAPKRTPISKKKQIRAMRDGMYMDEGEGRTASHKMAHDGPMYKRRGDFVVFPTIAPKPGKETSHDPSDWVTQGYSEAEARGEVIHVKRRAKAEKLAFGAWKQGDDKREAMENYREYKRRERREK